VGAGNARALGLSFARAVWRLVRRIPRGRVATYGQIAALLGRPRAARAVGGAMRNCPGDVPWHRVVNASGGISRRARMESMLTQRMLLIREGIPLRGGRISLRRYRWLEGKGRREL
jgi:methylated-DNA-protein-cysteine methyltransferase-like protein